MLTWPIMLGTCFYSREMCCLCCWVFFPASLEKTQIELRGCTCKAFTFKTRFPSVCVSTSTGKMLLICCSKLQRQAENFLYNQENLLGYQLKSHGLLWDSIWPKLAGASCIHFGRTFENDEDHWTESMALLLWRLNVRGRLVANPSAGLALSHTVQAGC